jgi:hypothetical protein
MAAPPPALLKGKSFKGPIKWNEENLEENEKIKASLGHGRWARGPMAWQINAVFP